MIADSFLMQNFLSNILKLFLIRAKNIQAAYLIDWFVTESKFWPRKRTFVFVLVCKKGGFNTEEQ